MLKGKCCCYCTIHHPFLLPAGEVLPVSSYTWDKEKCELVVHSVPSRPFQLRAVTVIHPEQHTDLEGLFCVGGVYATQVRAVPVLVRRGRGFERRAEGKAHVHLRRGRFRGLRTRGEVALECKDCRPVPAAPSHVPEC